MIAVITVMIIGDAVAIGSRRERYAAKHFGKARRSKRLEALPRGKAGCGELVRDHDELVRISAGVGVSADGRGDRPDRRGPIAIDATHEVAKAVAGGVPRQPRFGI